MNEFRSLLRFDRAQPTAMILATLLLIVQAPASADAIQRIERDAILEIIFHEKQPPPTVDEDGVVSYGDDAIGLVSEVARIVVEFGEAVEMPASLAAQFAVHRSGEKPASLLDVGLTHVDENSGIYRIADDSRESMAAWFIEHELDFSEGNVVLLRVDGLPDMLDGNAVSFDIEGECDACDGSWQWR